MLDITYGEATDAGLRPRNEDATCAFVPRSRREIQTRGWLFALADGVGGLNAGGVASSKAMQVIAEGFAVAEEHTSLSTLLPRLIQHANATVYDDALNPQWRHQRMATTVVACALRYDQATIAHVGDSRCYLVRDRHAELLTQDHSWVEEQRRQGLISEVEAEASESRHILTRTLGVERFVAADCTTIALRPRDTLILCSDGLYAKLGGDGMARSVAGHEEDAPAIARDLVCEAIAADASDNATAVVVCVRSVEAMALYRGRPYSRPGT